jgi:hypothetical protein
MLTEREFRSSKDRSVKRGQYIIYSCGFRLKRLRMNLNDAGSINTAVKGRYNGA